MAFVIALARLRNQKAGTDIPKGISYLHLASFLYLYILPTYAAKEIKQRLNCAGS
jgi:hypothetical protein